jgi:hypothetical protein
MPSDSDASNSTASVSSQNPTSLNSLYKEGSSNVFYDNFRRCPQYRNHHTVAALLQAAFW